MKFGSASWRGFDPLTLGAYLLAGAAWLLVLFWVLLGHSVLVSLGVAYVLVSSLVIAGLDGSKDASERTRLTAWVGLWVAAVMLWAWSADNLGTGDGMPAFAAISVGIAVGSMCLVAWVISSLALRWMLSKVVRSA